MRLPMRAAGTGTVPGRSTLTPLMVGGLPRGPPRMDGPAPVPAGSAFLAAATNKSPCVVILEDLEIVLGKIVYQRSVTVLDSHGHDDHVDVLLDGEIRFRPVALS